MASEVEDAPREVIDGSSVENTDPRRVKPLRITLL
jgi:hypothetical protein